MMWIRDADLGIRAVARLAGELERAHASDVALHGEHLEIKHEPRMIGIGGGHADGAVEIRQWILRDTRFGFLDATLHFAHGFEIMTDALPVFRPERARKARHVVLDE